MWKKGNGPCEETKNEITADERQTGSGKLRGERLKITADKDQPARKVSSWNPRWNSITAEKHQPTRMVGSWNPRGERIEIRVLKYKVQRTTAYAATTPTVSTVFHSKPKCHANMARLDTRTCSTCSERFFLALFHPKPNGCLRFDLESCNLMCTYTVVTHPCAIPPLAQARPMMLCIYTSIYLPVLHFYIISILFAYFLACHPYVHFSIFLFLLFLILFSVTVRC